MVVELVLGRELGKVEGGEAGRSVEAVLELRICMGWLRVERRSERIGKLLHGGVQFENSVLQDGVLEHSG